MEHQPDPAGLPLHVFFVKIFEIYLTYIAQFFKDDKDNDMDLFSAEYFVVSIVILQCGAYFFHLDIVSDGNHILYKNMICFIVCAFAVID